MLCKSSAFGSQNKVFCKVKGWFLHREKVAFVRQNRSEGFL